MSKTPKSQDKTDEIAEQDLDKIKGGAIFNGSDRAFNPQPEPPAVSQQQITGKNTFRR